MRQQVPERLRRHKFKKLLGADKELPPLNFSFWEKEACKAFNYNWDVWQSVGAARRGELIAHEQHKALREAYAADVQSASRDPAAGDKGPGLAPWDRVKAAFFKPKI